MNSINELELRLENLRKENSQLQIENTELSNNLFNVNQKLRESEQLKGHFISNITNEIINPFSGIMALAANLKHYKSGNAGEVNRMADLIYEEAFHLDFQLKNIFAVATIEAGKEVLNYSSIHIEQLFDQIDSYFQHLLKKKDIIFLIKKHSDVNNSEKIIFISDREKIELMLKNLISNSIKYSSGGSAITLDYSVNNNNFFFEVSDHGKGIEPADRKIIFDRFKQLDEKINSINTGHGLGLSIVQAYTEMLGGNIEINSNTDSGIRVMVNLPAKNDINVEELDDLKDFLFDSDDSY
jgi:signal transduction histidine kinase